MFIFGIADSTVSTFNVIVLGFEFESKIVPFGAKNFSENLIVFIVLLILTISPVETQFQHRIYFVFEMVIGVLSAGIMFFMKYKKVINTTS